VGGVRLRGRRQTSWAASDFVLGSYELFSKPKTKSDTAKPTDFVAVTFTPPHLRPRSWWPAPASLPFMRKGKRYQFSPCRPRGRPR